MKNARALTLRIAAGLLVAALLLYVTSSHWRASRFRDQIQFALQDSLHRPVKIGGQVSYNLLPAPGFSVEDVTIGDAPEFGPEPLAYVTRLEGRLQLLSLFSRTWRFSSLRLVDPSLNLAQDPRGTWNIQPLLEQRRGNVIPVEVRNARVNFRGDNAKKSPFYFTNARADINVTDGDDPLVSWSFEGQPARTDKGEQGFGQFSGTGRWQKGQLALDLNLERSAISELVTLLEGQSYGVQGLLASRAHFSGPPAALQVSGQVQLEDVNRWALLAQYGGQKFAFLGKLDLPGQKVELETATPKTGVLPLAFHLRGLEVLRQPRWAATVTLNELPLASVLPVAKRLGQSVPDALQMQGILTGVVGYSANSGLQGQVAAKDVALKISPGEPFQSPAATVLLNNNKVELQPLVLSGTNNRVVHLAAEYRLDSAGLAISVGGDSLPVLQLQTALDSLGVRSVPVLRQCVGGEWSGTAQYVSNGTPAGKWIGDGVLSRTSIALPGVADPIAVRRAAVNIDGDRVVVSGLNAKLGALNLQGEYRYEPGKINPHQFTINVPDADAAEIERLFLPSAPKPKGFLARTLKLGEVPPPARPLPQQVQGLLHFGTLHIGPADLEDVQSHLTFQGGELRLPDLSARYLSTPVNGEMTVNVISADAPTYHLQAKTQKLRWHSGTWDVDGVWESTGLGVDLLANSKASGTFQGRGGDLLPDLSLRTTTGTWEFQPTKGEPPLRLKDLQISTATRETYRGEGTAEWPGPVNLTLSSPRKRLNLTGTVSPWRVKATPLSAQAVR